MSAGDRSCIETTTAIATAFGALATGVMAFFIFLQIQDASNTFYINNSYMVEKDLADSIRFIGEAQVNRDAATPGSKEYLSRSDIVINQVNHFNDLFSSVVAMRNNDGIMRRTWKSLLYHYCITFSKHNYVLEDTKLSALNDACEHDSSWKGPIG